MIYRTLHSYILRELLRIFLLTATSLTTLMAFGGTFKPLTKQGIDVSQLLIILVNLMPAMLAYAIPIAALFAAVLVYWRMSTDNELTACRAGGVSFLSIVMPAFILGLMVASVDLVFVNYVVPRFLQSTERAVMRDLGSLIVSQIGRQDRFQYDPLPLVVSADSAELAPSDDPDVSIVLLHGMAASYMENGRPSQTAVGQEARLEIRNRASRDSAELTFTLTNSTVYDPRSAFKKYTGSIDSQLFNGRPIQVQSIVKSKPKFLNWRDLMSLWKDSYLFPPVAEAVDRIEVANNYREMARNLQAWWKDKSKDGKQAVTLDQVGMSGKGINTITWNAIDAVVSETSAPEESLTFVGRGGAAGVKVELRSNGKLTTSYTCDEVDALLGIDPFTGVVTAALQLQGHVIKTNHEQGIKPVSVATTVLPRIVLPASVAVLPVAGGGAGHAGKAMLVTMARESPQVGMQALGAEAATRIQKLRQTITSEFHSRGSFSLSCLTLVMFGAALGILLRGKNPLAVFVVGFVPAIILVLLITAGRQVTEGRYEHMFVGLTLIWAGNGVLLALVAGVYWKLLRR